MQALRHYHLSAEKVHVLIQGIKERDSILTTILKALLNTKTACSSHKTLREQEISLNEVCEVLKKAQDDLCKM